MKVSELIKELNVFSPHLEVQMSVKGVEAEITQVVWQGSNPVKVILDDFPVKR